MNYEDLPSKEFLKKYNEEHLCCPNCGSELHSTTLIGFVMDINNPELYKDKNKCKCCECGDNHITHDRVPKK
jgi:hypothetical protein